jgi:hypothetical protein
MLTRKTGFLLATSPQTLIEVMLPTAQVGWKTNPNQNL